VAERKRVPSSRLNPRRVGRGGREEEEEELRSSAGEEGRKRSPSTSGVQKWYFSWPNAVDADTNTSSGT